MMDAPHISHVASLTDEKAQTALLLTADSRHGALEVRMVSNAPVPADRDLELWAVPKSGNPRSLGLLADKGNVKLAPVAARHRQRRGPAGRYPGAERRFAKSERADGADSLQG